MSLRISSRSVRLSSSAAVVLVALLAAPGIAALVPATAAAADSTAASDAAEKEAFDAAKELGTVEAWQAFVTRYPSGFRADLARAYMKKLGEPAGAAAPATTAAAPAPTDPLPATEVPCAAVPKLSSATSTTTAKLVFVNATKSDRTLVWLGFDGKPKEYGKLKPGETQTQSTFVTHPWMVTDVAGTCRQVFMPGVGTTLARLEIEDAAPASAPTVTAPTPQVRKAVPKASTTTQSATSAQKSCRELGLAYRNGKCVAATKADAQRYQKQKKVGCPAGTYLNPLGVCQPNETGG